MPNFNGRGAPPLSKAPLALADMMASALRGGVKATLGMPGDVESLFRSDPANNTFPTTEDWDKRLPQAGSLSGENMGTFEKMGEFLPLPATLGVAPAAQKAGSMAKALRGPEQATDMGRRSALASMGKGGLALGAGISGTKALVDAIKAVPTPVKGAAKVAAKVATPREALMAINKGQPLHKSMDDALSENFTPEELGKLVKDPENLSWLNQAQKDDIILTPSRFSKTQREHLGIQHFYE